MGPRTTTRETRRTVIERLAGVGGVVGATALAGCTEGMGEGDDGPEDDDQEPLTAPDDADPDDEGWVEAWEDVDVIELEGETDEGWIGRRPAVIDGETNPDVALFEGEEYEFVWTNGDGEAHNLAIWDDEGPIVSTAFEDEEGATTEIDVEATEEMEQYLCETHPDEMSGGIEIRSA